MTSQTSPPPTHSTARLSQPVPCPIACRKVYERRCEGDPLYGVLSTGNAAVLNPHVSGILHLLKRQVGNLRSTTANVFTEVLKSDDAVAKHAIILMALHAEPAFREYWADRGNERVIAEFTHNVLPRHVHAVMTGHYDDLRCFVRDALAEYMIM